MNWPIDRREFLSLLASAFGQLTKGWRRTPETLTPYLSQPEEIVPGVATYYATTCRECPAGCGVLARTLNGRVVKLEGNPAHPLSQGALCARGQAALQGLYNPDRVTQPLGRDPAGKLRPVTWDEALRRLREALARPQAIGILTGETADSDADLLNLFAEAVKARPPVNLRLMPEAPLASAAEQLFGFKGLPEFDLEVATM
ncbi:MAG: hypothetical protein FJ279_37650, partial [Planctomycetes bacterium]|nr:hypothetical protein [Planctomycetota bacterium]